jgi:hypothetical protein
MTAATATAEHAGRLGARAGQVALDRLIEEGGDGPGGDRVGDQGADEAGSGGPTTAFALSI